MPRIILAEQRTYPYRCSVQVRPQDVNYGGHLGNDHLISLIGTARALLFRSMGVSEMDLGDGQTGIIIGEIAVNYKAEAFLFDELLIETAISEILRKGFRMLHRVSRAETVVALAEVGFVTYSYAAKKSVPVPEVFINQIGRLS